MASGVTIGAGAVAGMLESGQGEMLFTRPVPRLAFLTAACLVWGACEVLVLLGACLGAVLGGAFIEPLRELGLWRLSYALPELFALGAFMGAVALLASTLSSSRGQATGAAVAVGITSYLLSVISGLSESLHFLRWVSPFGYFDPGGAITAGPDAVHVAVLAVLAGLAYLGARRTMIRRDLVG
jgi:ABC-2 type transport system permease protein